MHNQPLHVLFVEDSEDDKELLLDLLGGEFVDIRHARVESAAELRAALARQRWDAIICDHGLPALDAPTALRLAQEQGSDAPFIVVSGSMTEEIGAATMLAGAADLIGKDNLSRLLPALKRELRKSSEMLKLRDTQARLRQIAYRDPLTGLPNRESLAGRLERLATSIGRAESLTLLVMNLNRFSLIQQTLGAEAAEAILRLVGERLRRRVGAVGLVASLGGDRFGVLLTAPAAVADPAALAEAISREVARPLQAGGQELFLAQRIGIAVYPRDGRDFHQLALNAEIAMSQIGIGGKPNYRFFDPVMSAAGQGRLAMEQALHRALQQDEFMLHYQPQVDIRSGRIVGAEALLRWRQPDGGARSPADFIPLLEETGLIVPVGEWALRAACLQNLAWQRAGLPPLRIAVNLSAIQFRQADLVTTVRRVLDETGLDHRCLELEITENVALHNEETVIATLAELRTMGVSLAIDDFGTGYSSLSYLRRFPVHKLKIDRSFVDDITEAEPDSPIVKAIVSLAHNLGLDVIAEGVETQRQADSLLACGCAEMQGYLFSRPLPAEAFGALLSGTR